MNRAKALTTCFASGFVGVALGAFGAHGLKNLVTPELLEIYKTGVFYQFVHTFAALALLALCTEFRPIRVPLLLFFAGIVLFSGSLYLLAVTGIRQLGMITPVGGALWLIAWIYSAWIFLRMKNGNANHD